MTVSYDRFFRPTYGPYGTAKFRYHRPHLEGEKDWENTCTSTVTENVAKEETDNNDLGVGEILFGDCGKVSEVGKNESLHRQWR